MNLYVTEIKAVDYIDGMLKDYAGPNVYGISFTDAQDYCNNNGLGYCKVVGLLVAEIPFDNYTPEPSRVVDYEISRLN